MIRPVIGFSSTALGQNWQQQDLSSLQNMPQQPAQNPASTSMHEAIYGEPKKKHTLLKVIAGTAIGAAAIYGLARLGVKIKSTEGFMGSLKKVSETIVEKTHAAGRTIKGWFSGGKKETPPAAPPTPTAPPTPAAGAKPPVEPPAPPSPPPAPPVPPEPPVSQ